MTKLSTRALLSTTVTAGLIILSGCGTADTNRNTGNVQRNTNASSISTANSNGAANVNRPAPAAAASKSPGGTIDIKSTPAGASVVLIADIDGGAGLPKPYGSTPTVLTKIAPGKYTVDIEKPGFKSYQKEVEVKEGGSVKIDAALKKQ